MTMEKVLKTPYGRGLRLAENITVPEGARLRQIGQSSAGVRCEIMDPDPEGVGPPHEITVPHHWLATPEATS